MVGGEPTLVALEHAPAAQLGSAPGLVEPAKANLTLAGSVLGPAAGMQPVMLGGAGGDGHGAAASTSAAPGGYGGENGMKEVERHMADFGDKKYARMVGGDSLMGSKNCFTWDEGARQCFILTDRMVQVLPVVDYDVIGCDRYTPHPHHWVPVKVDGVVYFVAGSPLNYENVDVLPL